MERQPVIVRYLFCVPCSDHIIQEINRSKCYLEADGIITSSGCPSFSFLLKQQEESPVLLPQPLPRQQSLSSLPKSKHQMWQWVGERENTRRFNNYWILDFNNSHYFLGRCCLIRWSLHFSIIILECVITVPFQDFSDTPNLYNMAKWGILFILKAFSTFERVNWTDWVWLSDLQHSKKTVIFLFRWI